VAGRHLFTDTTEHWKRRASLRGPSVHHVAVVSAAEASGLLLLGDWRACEERLRVVLGSTPGPSPRRVRWRSQPARPGGR
jgi:hypothetical protein